MRPPKDDIFDLLTAVPEICERTIICIASKIVAIHQGRTVPIKDDSDKLRLINEEASYAIPRQISPGEHATLTITDGSIIGSAGIDRSNGDNHFVLWPKNSHQEARKVRDYFLKRDGVKECGVIVADSHSSPMRRGAMGFSLGFAGFAPLKSYVGVQDIFGNPMKTEVENVVDALAAAASVTMGEGGEQTPVVVITDLDFVVFDEIDHSKEVVVPIEEDVYYPITKNFLDYPTKRVDR
jgi:F420-0:gamma-glutamyl ligase